MRRLSEWLPCKIPLPQIVRDAERVTSVKCFSVQRQLFFPFGAGVVFATRWFDSCEELIPLVVLARWRRSAAWKGPLEKPEGIREGSGLGLATNLW